MGAHHSVEANQATGWLDSTPLGCCAPGYLVDHNEGSRENDRNAKSRNVVSEQPRSRRQMREQALSETSLIKTARPTTRDTSRHWAGRTNVAPQHLDTVSRTSSAREQPWSKRPAKPSKLTKSRPQISKPTDFRHVDGASNTVEQATPRRRNAQFRPLQLSIYQPEFRLSPLPDFTRDSWVFTPELLRPNKALVGHNHNPDADGAQVTVRRKPTRSRSAEALVDGSEFTGDNNYNFPNPRSTIKRTSSLPDTSRLTLVDMGYTGLSSRAESPVDTSGPMAVPRTRTEGSNGSVFRKLQPRQASRPSIDRAIEELNTIVVEARANMNGPLSPSKGHVPAIAPHLKMTHVRSETLSDIGSAFSTPYSKHLSSESELPVPEIDLDADYEAVSAKADEKVRSDILVCFPQPPGAAVISGKSTRSRLAGLLRRSAKGMADSNATPSPTEPLIAANQQFGSSFYNCEDSNDMSSAATSRTVFGPNTSRYTANSFGSLPSESSTFVTVTESESDATSPRSMTPDTDNTTAGSENTGSPRSIHVPVRRLGVDTELRDSHARSMTASVIMDNPSKNSSRSNSGRSDQSDRCKPAARGPKTAIAQSSAAAKYTPAAARAPSVDDSEYIGVAYIPEDDDDVGNVQLTEPPMTCSAFDPLHSHPPQSSMEPDYGCVYGYSHGSDYEPEQQRVSVVGLAF